MAKIFNWHSETWNNGSAKVLLNNLQKNKGQTNETREHAALILSWMNLRQTITAAESSSSSSSLPTSTPATAADRPSGETNQEMGAVRNRHDSEISSTMSPRSSLYLETDPGGTKIGISNSGKSSFHLHSFID
jgi:hypothetical protein